jgi:peroxiredoxin
MAELADAADLKSAALKRSVGVRVPLSAPQGWRDQLQVKKETLAKVNIVKKAVRSLVRLNITAMILAVSAGLCVTGGLLAGSQPAQAQKAPIVWSEQEKPLLQQLRGLRQLPDDGRVSATKQLALQIRLLPATQNRVALATGLASLATEGDFGHDTLQEVATTLAAALRDQPLPEDRGQPAEPYVELATLVRYEHVQASLDTPQFAAAMAKLEAADQRRQQVDFTLTDLQGKSWNLKELRGKVVLVNFWATWCPPCRKEMPDLEALSHQFETQGLLILAISDETVDKVKPFVEQRKVTYPILLDPGRKVNELFQIEGIPKSFLYGRDGKLVTQAIDMRTRQQFLEMLKQAGLK